MRNAPRAMYLSLQHWCMQAMNGTEGGHTLYAMTCYFPVRICSATVTVTAGAGAAAAAVLGPCTGAALGWLSLMPHAEQRQAAQAGRVPAVRRLQRVG